MKRRIMIALARVMGTVSIVVLAIWVAIAQPTFRKNRAVHAAVDKIRLRSHVVALSKVMCPRDWQAATNLDRCCEYIATHFTSAGAHVEFQEFKVHKRMYRNVIGRFGGDRGGTLVIGAHYDTCDDTPGADDNASGVAALIELAYLLGKHTPNREIELVAYVLEEPPFFRTEYMGSAIHATRCAESNRPIAGMIALEMVGRYSDEGGSQSYPLPLFYLLYPKRGNFVGVIGRWDQGDWVRKIKVGMKGATDLPVYSVRAPSVIPGIDYSDHINYWAHGFPALMITDTALYRNKAYHSIEDTSDSLDYERLGKVVVAVYAAIESM